MKRTLLLLFVIVASLSVGCREARKAEATTEQPHKHEHKPPHGGTPVVLGDEEYHLELVLDAASGRLQAYVLDAHMDQFTRLTNETFTVTAQWKNRTETLLFKAVTSTATGEKVGDTALFEAQADWLKTATNFDAVIVALPLRGSRFEGVSFNFPKGNDADAKQ